MRGSHLCLRGIDGGGVGPFLGHGGIELLLADRLVLEQGLRPREILFRVHQRCLCLPEVRLRLRQCREVGLAIDHEQQLSAFHMRAVDVILPLENAVHPAADLHRVHRFGLRDIVFVLDHRSGCCFHHCDFGRRRLRRSTLLSAGRKHSR